MIGTNTRVDIRSACTAQIKTYSDVYMENYWRKFYGCVEEMQQAMYEMKKADADFFHHWKKRHRLLYG